MSVRAKTLVVAGVGAAMLFVLGAFVALTHADEVGFIVHISSNNTNPTFATTGDTVTVAATATSSDSIAISSMSIDNHHVAAVQSGNTWTASWTIIPSDPQGAVLFSFDYAATTTNDRSIRGTLTNTTDGSTVTVGTTTSGGSGGSGGSASSSTPTVSITSGPANNSTIGTSTVTFEFTVDASSTARCSFGTDTTIYACASPQTFSLLPDGTYTFTAYAVAGSATSSDARTFTVAAASTTATSTPDTGSTSGGSSGSSGGSSSAGAGGNGPIVGTFGESYVPVSAIIPTGAPSPAYGVGGDQTGTILPEPATTSGGSRSYASPSPRITSGAGARVAENTSATGVLPATEATISDQATSSTSTPDQTFTSTETFDQTAAAESSGGMGSLFWWGIILLIIILLGIAYYVWA